MMKVENGLKNLKIMIKMQPVIDELEEKNLLKISDGATIIDLDDITPALIKRSDGASLYITRDLAALFDRKKRYKFDEMLYVVGNEQSLHFEQVKRIVTKMGYDFADDVKHIGFRVNVADIQMAESIDQLRNGRHANKQQKCRPERSFFAPCEDAQRGNRLKKHERVIEKAVRKEQDLIAHHVLGKQQREDCADHRKCA